MRREHEEIMFDPGTDDQNVENQHSQVTDLEELLGEALNSISMISEDIRRTERRLTERLRAIRCGER